MYANGDGVPQDLIAAHVWLTLAAAGSSEAARAGALRGRDTVAQQLSPSQRAEADARARAWSPTREP
jgi:TPR repeat protein